MMVKLFCKSHKRWSDSEIQRFYFVFKCYLKYHQNQLFTVVIDPNGETTTPSKSPKDHCEDYKLDSTGK